MSDDILFANGNLHDWLQTRLQEALQVAQTISPDKVLATPEADLVQELVHQFKANPPQLRLEECYSPGAQDVKVDVSRDPTRFILDSRKPFYVSGTRFEVRVPFDGDPELFRLRPSSFSTVFPRGKVEGKELVIWHEAPADSVNPEQFKSELDRELEMVKQYLTWVAKDCANFNDRLEHEVQQAVQRRKQKVLQDRNLEAYLKIPVQRRPDASPVFSVPVERRRKINRTAVEPRPRVTEPFAPEPAISPDDYEDILTVIKSYRDLVERLPKTFSNMDEEVLRDILLVVLNNQFGPAGGEVFSRNGKTDVFLWHEKGAVFIAECKFWAGSKAFRAAVDQLLSYLVWRDTKAALILFVREKSVSDIAEKASMVLEQHPRYKRREKGAATFPVYVLHHEGDTNREIKVALVVVPLPRE